MDKEKKIKRIIGKGGDLIKKYPGCKPRIYNQLWETIFQLRLDQGNKIAGTKIFHDETPAYFIFAMIINDLDKAKWEDKAIIKSFSYHFGDNSGIAVSFLLTEWDLPRIIKCLTNQFDFDFILNLLYDCKYLYNDLISILKSHQKHTAEKDLSLKNTIQILQAEYQCTDQDILNFVKIVPDKTGLISETVVYSISIVSDFFKACNDLNFSPELLEEKAVQLLQLCADEDQEDDLITDFADFFDKETVDRLKNQVLLFSEIKEQFK